MKFLKFAFAAGVAFGGVARGATPAAKPKVDPAYLPYEKPGILAKIPNGQTIHIKCMGTGSPTVILTAGFGDWSAAWRKVQPQMAKTTRVCAWDRPGLGFSSGTTQPQTVVNTTADLEAALTVAHIAGPYIAVGHSLGGYESLLFKDHNQQSVVGMVLVDPSIPDQFNRLRKAAPAAGNEIERLQTGQSQMIRRCLTEVKTGTLKIGDPDPDGCLGYHADYPPQLATALVRRDTNPLRFTAFVSLSENFDRDGAFVMNPKRNYAAMPLVVLTADPAANLASPPPGISQAAKDELPAQQAEWGRAHDEIAALSSRGVNRTIAHSTHYIQYDQPQAVIDAVDEVVAAARSSKR